MRTYMRFMRVVILSLYIYGCNTAGNKPFNNASDKEHEVTSTIEDIVEISSSKFGFLLPDGTIHESYGDFDCISPEEKIFEFNVGCGRSGDIISILITPNDSKRNSFNLVLRKGDLYYGKTSTENIKIGEFNIISKDEIKGYIKLCLEEDESCCGEIGENFTLKRINTNNSPSQESSNSSSQLNNVEYLKLTKKEVNKSYKFEDDGGLISFLLPKYDFSISSDNSIKSVQLKSSVKVLFSETSQVDSPEAIWKKSDLINAMKKNLDVKYSADKKDWAVVSGFNKAGNIVYKKGFYFKPEDNFAGEDGENTQPWCQTVVLELEYPTQKKEEFDRIIEDLIKSLKVNFDAISENY